VDTHADPPRAIWHHPFDDDDFLRAHPDVRGQQYAPPPGSPGGLAGGDHDPRHASDHGGTGVGGAGGASDDGEHHRRGGMIGKLKDMKEARDARKLEKDEVSAPLLSLPSN
jgi:hypothetical protein